MEYKNLGPTGIKVSELCFGTMSFGGDADEATAEALFWRCREAGINFFDTADVYQGGVSEEILGRLIRGIRDELVIATKVYFPTGPGVNERGSSRKHLRLAVEASLRRLQTDYLDLYYLHRFDDLTDLDETLRGLDDLVQQGKILYPAVSNFAAWQVEKALGRAVCNGWARLAALQPMYNLVKRQAEVELLPMAQAENLAVMPYSPLGAGLLTGKYSSQHKPESGRLVRNKIYATRYGEEWVYQTAEHFSEYARQHSYEPAALAVAWVASHPGVTAPIIGARNLDQLEGSLKSVEIKLSPEQREEISRLSPEPPPATDRTEERTPNQFGQR